MNLAYDAMMFAREAHINQKRKYTGEPYANHLAEVAGIVAAAASHHPSIDIIIATAWLHDTVEDCGVSLETIRQKFGEVVAKGVAYLSDLEQGNRAERKRLSRERLAKAPAWVQNIKCADLISNTSSICLHDPNFAVVYIEEKRLLLDVLTKADPRLLALARNLANQPIPQQEWTVLLSRPDYIANDKLDTYMTYVHASSVKQAQQLAQLDACRADYGKVINTPELAEEFKSEILQGNIYPDDYAPLLVFKGHHTDLTVAS